MSGSGNPLVEALGDGTAAKVVNYIGQAGLIASFFSIISAYSRQLFALSRAGYLPTVLSVTNSRKAPTLALIVPGAIGFALSLTGQGALLLNMAVFGAALSYVLMMVSHIVLRRIASRRCAACWCSAHSCSTSPSTAVTPWWPIPPTRSSPCSPKPRAN